MRFAGLGETKPACQGRADHLSPALDANNPMQCFSPVMFLGMGCMEADCLAHWWRAFPQECGRRWYGVALGGQLQLIAPDSDSSLLPRSEQERWLQGQLDDLPGGVRFVSKSAAIPSTPFEVNHRRWKPNARISPVWFCAGDAQ
jgi:hypothetical protein